MTIPTAERCPAPSRRGRLLRVGGAILVGLILATGAAAPARADFESGVKAYDAGDFTTAYNDWLPIAAGGDPFAQRNIGHLYRLGLGVPQDFKVAFNWYQRAAEQGLVRAQANVANMLLRGQGVDQDPREAAVWFHRAASAGHAISQFNIGQMYRKGLAVPQDNAMALGWIQLAADAGHERSIELVAIMTAEGIVPAGDDALLAPPFGAAAPQPQQAARAAPQDDGSDPLDADDDEDNPFASLLSDDADAAPPPNRAPSAASRAPAPRPTVAPRATDDTNQAGDDTLGGSEEDSAPAQVAALPTDEPAVPPQDGGAIVGGEVDAAGSAVQPGDDPAHGENDNLVGEDDLLGEDDLGEDVLAGKDDAAGEDDRAANAPAQGETNTAPSAEAPPPQVAARTPEPLTRQPRISDEAMAAVVSEGLRAYQDKDYATALRTWLPLAESGNRDAQFFVGGLYMDGAGVPEDRVRAHAWWRLAADQGHPRATEFLELIVAVMSPDQLTQARDLAETFRAAIR